MRIARPALASIALLAVAACAGGDKLPGPSPKPSSFAIPVLGQGLATDRYTAELNVRGSYAYTSSWSQRGGIRGNAVKIWNVAGPTPTLVDSIVVAPYTAGASAVTTTGDVQVSDDGTLLAVATERYGGSLALYSLADPAHPTFISQFHSTDTDPGVHTAEIARVNGTLYGFLSIDPANGIPAKLVVVSLADPANPVQVLARTMGNPYVHDVFARDSLLFTALWDDGVAIWDIGGSRGGSPSNPVFISKLATFDGEVHNIWWFNDPSSGQKKYVFVGQEGPAQLFSSTSGDIHVVDISNITSPVEVAYYTLAGAGTHNFSVDEAGGTLYAAYYNGGVRALDIRGDLGSCAASARGRNGLCNLAAMGRERGHALESGNFIWGVQWVGDRLYASDMLHGLWALDVTQLRR